MEEGEKNQSSIRYAQKEREREKEEGIMYRRQEKKKVVGWEVVERKIRDILTLEAGNTQVSAFVLDTH